MLLSLLMACISLTVFGYGSINDPVCKSIPFLSDGNLYVTCKGNFTERKKLKLLLEEISESIKVFKLQDTVLDVLPPDVFHNVERPRIQRVIFDNISLELLQVPELGEAPLKSIRTTVDSLEIYSSPKVFAWDFPSLKFDKLQNIIIEDSELISVTVPFFFWPELRFMQIQNCSVRWVNPVAFQGNVKLAIFSLAHNKLSRINRNMFPKPATYLYSLDLSFNRLETFPEDMFSEMPALQELKLDNNRLKSLPENPLKQVWDNLRMLWMYGNQVPCEYLCWMFGKSEKPLFIESSDCKVSNQSLLINAYLEKCLRHVTPATT